MQATARAFANIALVKYWGKRDLVLNLPAAGSISLTLDRFETTCDVMLEPGLREDELLLDGRPATDGERWRVSQFLDLLRQFTGRTERARVVSSNNFPTGAGLASSASGFAALSLAASRALGIELSRTQLSVLARRGSGSAARSIFGGLVEMLPGTRADGADAFARPLAAEDYWDVRLVVAITQEGRKALGSTEAMIRTAETSPLYAGWLAAVPSMLSEARAAITARDIRALGQVTEHSALTMHASAMAARPPILYWHPGTLEVMQRVTKLRHEGLEAYFTMDAGPHVKVLCAAADAPAVEAALKVLSGVSSTFVAGPGKGASLVTPA